MQRSNIPSFLLWIALGILLAAPHTLQAQKQKNREKPSEPAGTKSGFDTVAISGMTFRSIGPAITSGRIADLAVDPDNPKRFFVAAASGGVWRTSNAGNTFEPVFDSQGSYSIGTVVIDPSNSSTIWVGSGENNNQRSVAYGDGIYKSVDGGSTWTNMGLKASEHIARIVVHPGNSDVVFVAAMGPLWSAGGDRGVYKTSDGGKTWEQVLKVDEHTGACDIVMDPRNPDVLFAATHQRRRHVFTYLGGGPGSAIYKSTDGGKTWDKATSGLPGEDLGRIGLAISPVYPHPMYAMVETNGDGGGCYRSTNGGVSWEKRAGYYTSGNYYVELIPDPKDADRLYSMDVWMKVSDDGGKTWRNVGEDYKHVDNHAIWIDPDDTEHLLVGCDGGLYETWDQGGNWRFITNLPLTQFYKVAVDNAEPFYHIYGGTQDNFSMGGPSRTISGNGISSYEWFMTHGGDGFESQVDPQDPNIVYAQSQHGVLVRYDKRSGEEVGIQPHEREGENSYRWNWDSPLAASRHVPGRVYFAANKLFVSEDRGDSWTVISDDLTRQIDRNKLKIMGRVWPMDAVGKNQSTSIYGNIVAFSESPADPNLLYVGTDDGLIQVTSDRGKSWRRIDRVPGAPDTSYVNAVLASAHNANVVYACFNHHKYGDFKPYLFVSRDQGRTWSSIASNLPERGSVYAIEEDHVDPQLLFAGTEFGFFVSNNGGASWRKFGSGLPTVAVRDIAIQRRENDIVLATFGRGFYVLDDYTPFRFMKDENLKEEGALLPVRPALAFEYSYPLGLPGKGFQGDDYYLGKNLGSEALITFYGRDKYQSLKDAREEAEKKRSKDGKDNVYPTYEQLAAERDEEGTKWFVVIRNAQGDIVRKLTASAGKKGFQRISWDLRTAHKEPARAGGPGFYNPFAGVREGPQVAPGTYTAVLQLAEKGALRTVGQPVSFEVRSLGNQVLPATDRNAMVAFKRKAEDLDRIAGAAQASLSSLSSEMSLIRQAVSRMEGDEGEWLQQILPLERKISDLQRQLSGDPLKARLDMDPTPTPADRIGRVLYESKYSSSNPTETHRQSLAIAERELRPIVDAVQGLMEKDLPALRARLQQAGAPYTPNVIPALKRE